jgi:hypothetical protein
LGGANVPDDTIQINEWKRLAWYEPAEFLRGLRRAEVRIADWDLEPKVRHLRTHELRPQLEARQAALFAHGMSEAVGSQVLFAMHEAGDHDFVTAHASGDTRHFTPIQLKEWVPPDLNPRQSLHDILNKLPSVYPTPSRTAVAIHVNRPTRIEFAEMEIPNIALGGLWLFGASAPDQTEWFLYGSLLHEPLLYTYRYPSP